jgi:hypothetical protein
MSSYIPIASQTLSSSASSVTFSSIPTTLGGKTLRDLVIVLEARTTGNGFTATITGNGQGGATVGMEGNGSSASSETFGSGTVFQVNNGLFTSSESTAATAHIFDYSATGKLKPVLTRSGRAGSGVAATASLLGTTSAITSVVLAGFGTNWAAGSTFSLFGLEG